MSDSAEQRTVKLLEKTPPAITLFKMSLIYLFLAGKRGPREGLYVVASRFTLPENEEVKLRWAVGVAQRPVLRFN
jgi:hypothetical protein